MKEREHAVLSLFYNERNQDITPSFLAYRMRMSTRDATTLLDGMVKNGSLELHVDDEGHINYRLPASERDRLHRHGGPTSSGHRASGNPGRNKHHRRQPSAQPPQGADATPGYGKQRTRSAAQGFGVGQSSHDGTDGSIRSSVVTSRSVHGNGPTVGGQRTTAQSHPDAPYQDWYAAGENPPYGQHGTAPQASQQRHRAPGHHPPHPTEAQSVPPGYLGNYGKMPEHHALTPYQSDRHPAHFGATQHYRERIPILAGALSLLVPGLGQFYNGEIGKGVMLLFSCLFLWVFLLFWIVWIWSVIDAYMVAEQANQRALADEGSPRPLLSDQRPHSNPNSNAA